MAPGGIETLVLDLALADPQIRVISLEGNAAALSANWPGLTALGDRFIALGKPANLVPRLIATVAKHLRRWNAGAVIAHHIGPLLYGGLGARLAGVQVRVHVEHDGWHYENARRRRIGRFLDSIVQPRKVAVSHGTANMVCAALDSDYIEIIPNGVDMRRFHPSDKSDARKKLGLPVDVILIGTVGRMVHVKGHDLLIKATARLKPHIHLALAGNGEEQATLMALVQELNLSSRVHFLGHINHPEHVYPAFDLFCLPSRAEGFPRSLIEAQACDIPVVATDVGGSSEAVCPRTGHLTEAGNVEALARALQHALEHASPLQPREFVNPKFSLERTVEAYRQVSEN